MTATSSTLDNIESTFVAQLEGLYVPWEAEAAPDPQLVALNAELAAELGFDASWLRSPEGVAVLCGTSVPAGATPVAMAYAGHQFGNYSPRLGDGRALLVGEVVDRCGARRDLHLKGSGRTPFSRGGDGKAALGPMLRELVIGEAMAALGIPTTRALAVVTTGEQVARDEFLPGAVLARVAASHLRVGTFEYAARLPDSSVLARLTDYAIARHYPALAGTERPALRLLEAVADAQAALVARWMLVGFIHGVMNTDNMTISGETIDYGPCAFMDHYDPATVFSSIDHGGRYAYGNQPAIAQWNLTRFAETLLPLIDPDIDTAVRLATDELNNFPGRYRDHWQAGMGAKLGIDGAARDDAELSADLLQLLAAARADYTSAFRALAMWLRGAQDDLRAQLGSSCELDGWLTRWQARVAAGQRAPEAVAAAMDAVNPRYIPRNHLVEEALAAAGSGDLQPLHELLGVLRAPFEQHDGRDRFSLPAPPEFGSYQTFCGT